jgi:putative ABC transport system permease protein
VTTLKKKDAQALAKILEVKYISSYVEGTAMVKYHNENISTKVIGADASYLNVESIDLVKGSFFTKADEDGVVRVAVIGWQLAQDFFGDDNPIGKKIKIKKETFRVIGTLEKRGSVGFENQDSVVVIPIGAAQKLIFGINHLHSIAMKLNSEQDVPFVEQQIKDILRQQHNIDDPSQDDFTVYTVANFIETLSNITNALKYFLAIIAAVSLVVGGVGIMNIMLVSVNERTQEIGLRKAVGARSKDIQEQFLTESITVTVLGGVVGILIGVLISGLIAAIAHYLDYSWSFVITLSSILLGVGVSALTGTLFGWYPAKRAADLQPVESLRYE